jgi:hypothetical protein
VGAGRNDYEGDEGLGNLFSELRVLLSHGAKAIAKVVGVEGGGDIGAECKRLFTAMPGSCCRSLRTSFAVQKIQGIENLWSQHGMPDRLYSYGVDAWKA